MPSVDFSSLCPRKRRISSRGTPLLNNTDATVLRITWAYFTVILTLAQAFLYSKLSDVLLFVLLYFEKYMLLRDTSSYHLYL